MRSGALLKQCSVNVKLLPLVTSHFSSQNTKETAPPPFYTLPWPGHPGDRSEGEWRPMPRPSLQPLTSCVTLGDSLNLSELGFLSLQSEGEEQFCIHTYF